MCAVLASFLKTPADFEAVHLRHHQVEQNDIRRTAGDFLQRLHAVFGFGNFIAARFQGVAQQRAVLFFVVHDQHETVRSRASRRTTGLMFSISFVIIP